MTNSLWETAANTPWWFYLMVIVLFRLSLLARHPRIIHIRNLYFVPSLFIPLSLFTIFFTLPVHILGIAMWVGALFLGIVLGWLQFKFFNIKAIRHEAKLHIPGSWNMFIFLLVLCVVKYYYNYHFNFDWEYYKETNNANVLLFLYGLLAGLMLGKIFYSKRCIKVGPFFSLNN